MISPLLFLRVSWAFAESALLAVEWLGLDTVQFGPRIAAAQLGHLCGRRRFSTARHLKLFSLRPIGSGSEISLQEHSAVHLEQRFPPTSAFGKGGNH